MWRLEDGELTKADDTMYNHPLTNSDPRTWSDHRGPRLLSHIPRWLVHTSSSDEVEADPQDLQHTIPRAQEGEPGDDATH
jgi:hypothetical protein